MENNRNLGATPANANPMDNQPAPANNPACNPNATNYQAGNAPIQADGKKGNRNASTGNTVAKVAAGVAAGVAGAFGAQAAAEALTPELDPELIVDNAVDMAQDLVDTPDDVVVTASTPSYTGHTHSDNNHTNNNTNNQPEENFDPNDIRIDVGPNGNIRGDQQYIADNQGDYPDPFHTGDTEILVAERDTDGPFDSNGDYYDDGYPVIPDDTYVPEGAVDFAEDTFSDFDTPIDDPIAADDMDIL